MSAIAVALGLAVSVPAINYRLALGAVAFSAMGMVAQAVSHSARKHSGGSIAFLPFLTSLVLYPSWVSVVLVALAMLVGEARQKKANIKRAFNVAQYAAAVGVATAMYLWLGGKSIQVDEAWRPVPHISAVLGFLLINTTLVATAVGLSTRRSPFEVWQQNGKGTFLYDLIAIPLVYWCALFYTKLGWAGVAAVFVVLGVLQQFYMKQRLLEIAYEETLELLVGAVELRDPYTSGHSQRVRKYSQIIASALNLPAAKVERVGVAALLHDVGKIDGVFVSILQKPGRLSPEERAIMELHPVKSAELVARATQLADIVPAVRHHHENWNGTGYPDRLAGKAIPLASRIIMFADTIDAMTTDRPYRKALSEHEVRAELQKHSGTQFDPEICSILINSTEFARIFDKEDSGRVQSLTQIFDRVRKKTRTPAVA